MGDLDADGTESITDEIPQLLVVTGMSGAGRSTSAKVLEDLGFYVIDNLPPELLRNVVDLNDLLDTPRRLAVVIDARGGFPVSELEVAIAELEQLGIAVTVVFLDADDDVLIQRYEEHRRPHPVEGETLADSIKTERAMLSDMQASADMYLNTSETNVHELRRRIEQQFAALSSARPMRVAVTSFGFKNGAPRDVALMFDVRFLPNPHWIPELRVQTGRHPQVAAYVLSHEDAQAFNEHLHDLLLFLLPRFRDEGKFYVGIGIGCTGGRHRSVALAEDLARWLAEQGYHSTVRHRDVDR